MLTLQRFKYVVCKLLQITVNLIFTVKTMTTHRVFAGLFVIGIEVAVARLNGARSPGPTDIPLRACHRQKEHN